MITDQSHICALFSSLQFTVYTVQESRTRAQEALRADEGRWLEEERKLMERRVKHQVQVPPSHTHHGTPLTHPPWYPSHTTTMVPPSHTHHGAPLTHSPWYPLTHPPWCPPHTPTMLPPSHTHHGNPLTLHHGTQQSIISIAQDLLPDNQMPCTHRTLRPF